MGVRYIAVPEIPDSGLTDVQAQILSAIKENVELLTGTRGEGDLDSRAVARGDVTAKKVGLQNMSQVSAKGSGFTISGSDVASLAEFSKLIDDVQQLANDLFITRQALDLIIGNLGGK